MHEYALVSSIFDILNQKIKEYNVKQVKQVKLKVGDMTGVEDMTMKACFEVVAKDTPVEGAELVIERIPIKAQCKNCNNEFIVHGWDYKCPKCNETGVKIIEGKELYIESIEAE